MRIFFTIAMACLYCLPVFSQDPVPGQTHDPLYYMSVTDSIGKAILSSDKLEAEGNPMLNDNWGNGFVRFKNKRISEALELRFSLTKNQLTFRKNGMAYEFRDTVMEFQMDWVQDNEQHKALFRKGYPAIKGRIGDPFYEVVEDGKNVHLIVYLEKKIQELLSYNAPPKRFYATIETWYVYDVKRNKLTRITDKKKNLRDALPEYAESIEKIAEQNKKASYSFNEIHLIINALNYL